MENNPLQRSWLEILATFRRLEITLETFRYQIDVVKQQSCRVEEKERILGDEIIRVQTAIECINEELTRLKKELEDIGDKTVLQLSSSSPLDTITQKELDAILTIVKILHQVDEEDFRKTFRLYRQLRASYFLLINSLVNKISIGNIELGWIFVAVLFISIIVLEFKLNVIEIIGF